MGRLACLTWALVVGSVTATSAPADEKDDKAKAEAVKAEVKRLAGTWNATSGTNSVKSLTFKSEAFPGNTVDLSGLLPAGTMSAAAVWWAGDPDKTPREINFSRQDGLRYSYYPGIYELKGDTLTLCVDLTPSPDGPPVRKRPTKFGAVTGSSYTQLILKRAKP